MAKTIQQLFDATGAKPGELEVKLSSWGRGEYLIPFFRDDSARWHCLASWGEHIVESTTKTGWEIYDPPKAKIKRWFWASVKGEVTFAMYSNKENEGNEDYPIKLLWSETEFDS